MTYHQHHFGAKKPFAIVLSQILIKLMLLLIEWIHSVDDHHQLFSCCSPLTYSEQEISIAYCLIVFIFFGFLKISLQHSEY